MLWLQSSDFDNLVGVIQSRATKAMAEFATLQGVEPGAFLSSNALTVEQTTLLRHYAYLSTALTVLDEIKADVLKNVETNVEPFPLIDRLSIERAVPKPTTPELPTEPTP